MLGFLEAGLFLARRTPGHRLAESPRTCSLSAAERLLELGGRVPFPCLVHSNSLGGTIFYGNPSVKTGGLTCVKKKLVKAIRLCAMTQICHSRALCDINVWQSAVFPHFAVDMASPA